MKTKMSVSFPTILGESCTAQGKQQHQPLSRVRLFATPQTAAHQAPLSMGLSRQEYWSGLTFPSPGYLPDLRIEPGPPALQEIDNMKKSEPRKRLRASQVARWSRLHLPAQDTQMWVRSLG